MYNLLLKDVLIQKKTIAMSILISIIYSFIFKNNNDKLFVNMFISIIVVMFSYIFINTACSYDDKAEKMLNSLPVKRIDIVLTKYISIFLFLIISFVICTFVLFILNFEGLIHAKNFMTFENILGPGIAVILLNSIYFPMYFRFGYNKTRYVNLVVFFSIFFIPQVLSKKITMSKINGFIQYFNSKPDWIVVTGIIVITFIILLISFVISYFGYKKREFS